MATTTTTGKLAAQADAGTPTIGDLIGAEKTTQKALSEASAALNVATDALKAASEAANQADSALSVGLATTGPVFLVLADGTAEIYSSDGAGSYHVTIAQPVSAPLS